MELKIQFLSFYVTHGGYGNNPNNPKMFMHIPNQKVEIFREKRPLEIKRTTLRWDYYSRTLIDQAMTLSVRSCIQ